MSPERKPYTSPAKPAVVAAIADAAAATLSATYYDGSTYSSVPV